MSSVSDTIHVGAAIYQVPPVHISGGFTTIDGVRYARIENVDQMAPFLMTIVSDSDTWLFVGSNGPFTAGRRSPDSALFPYQTVDKILRDPATSGARTTLLVRRDDSTALWEPWLDTANVYQVSRDLYKRVDGTAVLFEETNHDLGVRFRWRLEACERFGLVRHAAIEELAGEPVGVRYLDGFHHIIPPGVDQETYARLSYLAAAYMRHEKLPGVPLAVYALNASITDRAEPSESLRVAAAWSVGHTDPVILLSDRQLGRFRRGEDVHPEQDVRGEIGSYLVADSVELAAYGRHAWFTVGDTRLDHPAIAELSALVLEPEAVEPALETALAANRTGVRRRVAAADGLQQTADEAAATNHFSNVTFNIMRGGALENGYVVPLADLRTYLRDQDRDVAARHEDWVAGLPSRVTLHDLPRLAEERGDPQLSRLVGSYLPLTYSRRHGDPSRPWNRFSIRVRDDAGEPVFGYQGNWRDIFQNWDALGRSYPGILPAAIDVFLNASTADGYNPYRITRAGIDWEVEDPKDPWSHIGYWGDHQIVYLLRLLESHERHAPGSLADRLDARTYAYASVPYRIADLATMLQDPRATITFDHALHGKLIAAADELGADGKLLRGPDGEVRLVTLLEKLLVPLLVKLTNLVPGGGIWLNTQRPEWNDANNALAGWGMSVVTLGAIRRYLRFLGQLVAGDAEVPISAIVADLLGRVTEVLRGIGDPIDDAERFRVLVDLGRAGEEHRSAVYSDRFGETVPVRLSVVRDLLAVASPVVDGTLRSNRRDDALYHSYNLLRVGGGQASVDHLGPMLEGQVAILDSGILDDREAVELLHALRASDMYRPDQHSYLLYPDRRLTPYAARNTMTEAPPIDDPHLFVRDRSGAWHFQADLSTVGDVKRRLEAAGATPDVRDEVLELWRRTFHHDEFTGRSGTFFMFEGLGSIYWHMVAKLLLAVQDCHRAATDPGARAELAGIYHDIRDGLGFRKSPDQYGAFPTDAYSHTPIHRGAQQPGMTGQVKEQILTRLGELGVEVVDGAARFEPRLVLREEFHDEPTTFAWLDVAGRESSCTVAAPGLAFTLCQVAVRYRLGGDASIELERSDGRIETVAGTVLSRAASAAIFERRGTYRMITVTVPEGG